MAIISLVIVFKSLLIAFTILQGYVSLRSGVFPAIVFTDFFPFILSKQFVMAGLMVYINKLFFLLSSSSLLLPFIINVTSDLALQLDIGTI